MSTMFATIADYAKWASIALLVVPVIIGRALMSVLSIENEGGLLAGI